MRRRIFILLTLIPMALLCLVCASGCEARPAEAAASPEAAPTAQLPEPESSAAVPLPTRAPAPGPDGTKATPPPAPESTVSVTFMPAPSPEPSPEPEYSGPDLVECEPVDDEYFNGAAFFGNSLVDGLSLYGGIRNADFYAATSASVVNVDMTRSSLLESGDKGTLLQAMTEKEHEKIYILLGINEIGFEPGYFAQLYGTLLDRIRQAEPDSDIYIMSLSPVTESCSESSDVFNMERIGAYNGELYALARDRQCYYVDLCAALAGEDGYLAEDDSTDGIHLRPEKYSEWAQYLRTHVKE